MLPIYLPVNNCNSDVVKWRGSGKRHIELAMGKTGDGGYNPTRLSVWPWALLFVIVNAILIGNLSCCKVFDCCKMNNMTLRNLSWIELFAWLIFVILVSSWIKVFTIRVNYVSAIFLLWTQNCNVGWISYISSVIPFWNRQSCLKRKPMEVHEIC